MQNKTEKVLTSQIQVGDTVMIDGHMVTVGKETITHSEFSGVMINGQTFRETGRIIERVLFTKWYQGKITAYVRQIRVRVVILCSATMACPLPSIFKIQML